MTNNRAISSILMAGLFLTIALIISLFNVSTTYASTCGKITGISIIDLSTGSAVPGYRNVSWRDNMTIDLSEMPSRFNVEVVTSGYIQSVRATLDGRTRTENVAPYRFPAGDHNTWNPSEGHYQLVAKAYLQDRAKGTRCDTDKFQIKVVEDKGIPPRPPVTDIMPPTAPTCTSGDLLWVNDIDVTTLKGNAGIPAADVRFKKNGTTQLSIPNLPTEFDGNVTINITEAIAWDGYQARPNTGDQPNERFKLVALKNGAVVYESAWTGTNATDDGVATGLLSAEWVGSLGSTTLTNGADELLLVHWSDAEYGTGDTSSYNSVVPSSICIDYSVNAPDMMPPTAPTCASGDLLWVNNIDVTTLKGNAGIPEVDVRFVRNRQTQLSIPNLPTEFNGSVNINITEAIAWDGYQARPNTGDQPNERFKLVALKNGAVVYESAWTGTDATDDGVATGLLSTEWIGSLGRTTLANGADELLLVHWSDAEYGAGATSSPNSVVPSSLCIDYRVNAPD